MIISFKDRIPDIEGAAFVAPNAMVIGNVSLDTDASVWFGAVLRGDFAAITIGRGSNIQDNAVLHVDKGFPITVGNNVIIGHGAILHGCTVGDNCVIGMGAIVLNGAIIGENSIVGAGALVRERDQFPPGSLIVGNPAVLKKQLKEIHFRMIKDGAALYVENAKLMQEEVNKS